LYVVGPDEQVRGLAAEHLGELADRGEVGRRVQPPSRRDTLPTEMREGISPSLNKMRRCGWGTFSLSAACRAVRFT
jgi:hypothetical protein